jgi:hypothetical protein
MTNSKEKKFKISMRIVTIVLVAALLIGYTVFVRLFNHGTTPFSINIIVPWGLIAVFISFYVFNESNRAKKARRDERREYMNERRQQVLEGVIKSKNKRSNDKKD